MPMCPGCRQPVSYDHLKIHERSCNGLQSAEDINSCTIEQLERRLIALETRLDNQIRDLEADAEQQLLSVNEPQREELTYPHK